MSDQVTESIKQRNGRPMAPSKPAPFQVTKRKIINSNKAKKIDNYVIEVPSLRRSSRSVAADLINKNKNGPVAGPPAILSIPAALFTLRKPIRNDGISNMEDNESFKSLTSSLSLNNQSLNESIIESCIYSDAHEELLQTHYNAAQKRVIELSQTTNAPFHLKMHTFSALKIYTAISTLLYATLSIARANELDLFIRQNSVHLPQSIFDLNEWAVILSLAKEHRSGKIGVSGEADADTSSVGSSIMVNKRGNILLRAATSMKSDLQTMRRNIIIEMAAFDKILASASSQVKANGTDVTPLEKKSVVTDALKDEINRLHTKYTEEIRNLNEKHAEVTTKIRVEYADNINKLKSELNSVKSTTEVPSTVDDTRTRYEEEINSLKAIISVNDEQLMRYKAQINDNVPLKDAMVIALEQELQAVRNNSEHLALDTSKFATLNVEYNAARLKLDELNGLVASTLSECNVVTGKWQSECEKNTVLSNKLMELDSIPKAYLQEIERLHGEVVSLQQKVKGLEEHIEDSSRPSDPVDGSVDPKELLQREIESNKVLIFKLKQIQADLDNVNKSKNTYTDQLSALTKDREAMQVQLLVTSTQLSALTNDRDVIQAQLQAASSQLQVLAKDHESSQLLVETLTQSCNTLNNKIIELQRNLDYSVTAKTLLNEQVSKDMAIGQSQASKVKQLEKTIVGLGGTEVSGDDKQLIESLRKRINELEKANLPSSKPSITSRPLSPLANYSSTHHGVAVRVQKLIRGFLGRVKVRNVLMKHVASDRGILVACDGTKQGETDANGNYLLLCGPITKEMHELAKLDAESIYDVTLPSGPSGWLNKSLTIDYVGLSGVRIQIETLVDDLKENNAQLKLTAETLNNYKNQVKIDMENLNINQHEAIKRLANENIRLQTIINKLSAQRISDAKNSMSSSNQLSEYHLNCVVKVQAAVRGIKCRQKLVDDHREKFAEKDGVLHAIGRTVQGTEGWYKNSKDSVLYFAIDESGKWKCIAGPIDRILFDVLIRPPVVKGIKNTNEVKLYKFNASSMSSEFQGIDVYVHHDTQRLCALFRIDDLINSTY